MLHNLRQKGYIMLPVMLTVALVATIAFMMNMEGTMGARSISNDLEAEQARYVVEAGLRHAQWQVEQAGCGPYTDITGQTFGNHSYSATITPNNAGGQITTYSVPVSDDAWIKSDTPTQNYGNDAQLTTYFNWSPSTTQRTLYRFDIASAGIAPGALVVSAVAKIFVVDSNDSASVTAHQITADWTEATVNWDNINASHDTSSIASIPSGSPVGEYVSVNITSLVQGWINGSTNNQGIMLKTAWIDDLAQFTSKEYGNTSQHPVLEIKVTDGSLSNRANIDATGTLSSGIAQTLSRNDMVLYQHPPSILLLQPDAVEGKDAEIWDQAPNNKYGNAAETWVSSASNDTTRSLLRFNMGAIPAGARILGAALSLHRQSGSGADQPVSANRIMNPWSEDSVTWNSRESGTNWDTAGADFDNIAVATTPVGPVNQRYEWNITPLVQGWVDGSYPNYGVALTAAIAGMPGERFYTSDHADPSLWPNLSIIYACECGVICMAPSGTGNVLLVVVNEWDITSEEQTKRELFEGWGYTVNLISQWDVDWNFDNLAANNDVAYVSESVDETTWGLAPKLAATTIGVVNEEGAINSDLGISSNYGNSVGKELDVIDTSHYITALFPAGILPIYSANMENLQAAGTLATDLQTLGSDFYGAPGLAVVETGGLLADGSSTAAGRRVMLPIGRNGIFNWDYLNNNGRLMVQRALQWGAGAGSEASALPIAHWKLDDAAGNIAVDSVGGHNGTVTGAVWITGQIDGALDFDLGNVLVPHHDTLALTEAFTFVVWANSDVFGSSYQTILNKGRTGNFQDYWFGTWQRELVLGFFTGGVFREVYTTGLNLQTGTWYQLAATFDNATDQIRLYLNGSEVLSATTLYEPPVNGEDLVIGRSQLGEYWNGRLDDMRIYNTALSATEIADLYILGSGGGGGVPPPDVSVCNGAFRDEFTATDYTGNDSSAGMNWLGDWQEVNETDGAGRGDEVVKIDSDASVPLTTNQLRVQDNDGGGEGVLRELDLTGAASATLSFLYRPYGMDDANDYVAVELSTNGSAGPWAEITRFQGPADESIYQTFSQDISDSISANTALRFISSAGLRRDEGAWFDDVDIACSP